MSSIKLDLSQFSHLSSDDKSTKLQHKDGHVLELAHKKLSEAAQKQLEALAQAKGTRGKTDVRDTEDKRVGSVKVQDDEAEQPTGKVVQKLADGGDVTNIADSVVPDVMKMDAAKLPDANQQAIQDKYNINAAQNVQMDRFGLPVDDTGVLDKMFGSHGETPKDFDSKAFTKAQTQQADEATRDTNTSAVQAQQIQQENAIRAQAGLPPLPMPAGMGPMATAPQEQAPQSGPNPGIATPQQSSNGMPADPMAGYMSGFSDQMKAANMQAKAQGDLGNVNAGILAKQQEAQSAAQAHFDEAVASNRAEREALQQDIKDGHVDPNKFWTGDPKTGEGGHSKIAAGIGMILAGFNPTGKPNAAIDFIQHQMDKSIEAQARNLSSKESLLHANLQAFGNIKDAAMMTRLQMADQVTNELQTAAAKAQTPMAKAAALNAIGQVKERAAPLEMQYAMRRAMMNVQNSGKPGDTAQYESLMQMRRAMGDHAGAKEMAEMLVPGVGVAKVPVPEAAREKFQNHAVFETALKDLDHFVKHTTTLIPGTPDYITGQQKAMTLQAMIREGKLGTVYREGEQPLLDKFINTNPAGAMKMLQTVPQIKELLGANNRDLNSLKATYGLPTQQQADPRAQAAAWAQANPGPKADAIMKALGKK